MRSELINEYFFYDRVLPEAMDHIWASGWRHFGRYFYRYSLIPHGGRVCNVLPLRIRLSDFKPSRSQKRVLKRNRDLEVRFQSAFVDDQVLALFEKHKTRFKDNVPDSIYTFISPQPGEVPCEALSVSVYLKGELVAISYLDIGKDATSSVYQCFDPDLSKRSLGVFMILVSARYAVEQGKTFYYPGYVYKESSHYDYKKNFGALEAFDWQGSWQSYARRTTMEKSPDAPTKTPADAATKVSEPEAGIEDRKSEIKNPKSDR